MSLTATFENRFTAAFTPPDFSTQLVGGGLPLLTELDGIIQTESSLDILTDTQSGMVILLTAHRVGMNSFRVSGVLST